MIVSEAIDMLRKSELNQLAVKDDKVSIIEFINLGITELYKRFDLWKEEATITMASGITKYTLDSTDINVRIDGDDHEFLTIYSILDMEEEEIKINKDSSDYGITVPRFNRIKIKNPVAGDTLEVVYKAAPKFIIHEKQNIDLPLQFIEALFHYVGYRAHGSVNGSMEGENNTHYMRFDQSCKRIVMQGLVNEDSMQVFKLESRGFV